MIRHAMVLGAILAAGPATAGAQVSGTLDLGAGTYRPDRAIPGGIASIAPTLRYRTGPLDLDAAGVYSDAPAGRWNFQGTTAATLRSPALGLLHGELAGEIDWTSHYRVRGTTSLGALVRVYATPSATTRLWLGGGSASAAALGRRRSVQRSEFGTTTSIAGVRLGLRVLRTSFELMGGPADRSTEPDSGLAVEPAPADSIHSRRSALTDAVLSGRWRIGSLEFDASVGRRFSQTARELTIWGMSASRELTPMLDLVAAAGRSGSDPAISVPGARYFVAGLRLKLNRGPPPLALPPAPRRESLPFRVGPALGGGREVVIRVPHARAVELAGDFTDWRPVPLEAWGEDGWRTVLAIPAGVHRMAIRVDGGEWSAPPGVRPIPSEFGGEVAEFVVE